MESDILTPWGKGQGSSNGQSGGRGWDILFNKKKKSAKFIFIDSTKAYFFINYYRLPLLKNREN